jgi:hypothetical protein
MAGGCRHTDRKSTRLKRTVELRLRDLEGVSVNYWCDMWVLVTRVMGAWTSRKMVDERGRAFLCSDLPNPRQLAKST